MISVTTPTIEGRRVNEQELRKAKAIALEEMEQQANELGANAVLSVDLDYETIQVGSGGGMLMVSASGTAVVLG
jgi:uncharacterized protein YbjQ (UPF0145 family)